MNYVQCKLSYKMKQSLLCFKNIFLLSACLLFCISIFLSVCIFVSVYFPLIPPSLSLFSSLSLDD